MKSRTQHALALAVATAAAVLLAGSAAFAPLAGYQILFPQFAPIGLALPALLFAFPRALRAGQRGASAVSAAALLFLAFAANTLWEAVPKLWARR